MTRISLIDFLDVDAKVGMRKITKITQVKSREIKVLTAI